MKLFLDPWVAGGGVFLGLKVLDQLDNEESFPNSLRPYKA